MMILSRLVVYFSSLFPLGLFLGPACCFGKRGGDTVLLIGGFLQLPRTHKKMGIHVLASCAIWEAIAFRFFQ